jgi:hypothetical protein
MMPSSTSRRSSLAVLVLLLVLPACAARSQEPRHLASVSVLSLHATLAAIQDTEALVVCTAAPPPCLSPEQHRAFASKLAVAFGLDEQILREVRAWPPGSPLPLSVTNAIAQARALIAALLAALPDAPPVAKLHAVIGGSL